MPREISDLSALAHRQRPSNLVDSVGEGYPSMIGRPQTGLKATATLPFHFGVRRTSSTIRIVSTSAARVVQAALKPDCSADELGDLAASDPAFALRVLAIVNSPAFALKSAVDDIRRATSMLGVRGLRNLALSMVVADMAPPGPAGELVLAHSLRRALAAKELAAMLGHRETDAFFTTGLFLESGILSSTADQPNLLDEVARAPAAARSVQERVRGLAPYPESGRLLADALCFKYRGGEEATPRGTPAK